MIAYMTGTVAEVNADGIVLDHNGCGYEIGVPASDLNELHTHTDVKIYTYLSVKEDGIALFGFLSKDELELFKMLIQVNGIGPRGAVAILGTLNAEELRFAIAAGDDKAIAKAPGIGKKTAQRIILDLKDKIDYEAAITGGGVKQETGAGTDASDARGEAILALEALGYTSSEALRSLRDVDTKDMDTEQIIRAGLKNLATL